MSGATTPPFFQPNTAGLAPPSDPHAVLALVLSLLEQTAPSAPSNSAAQCTAQLATARSLSRSAQEALLQAKSEVEGARLRVEDGERALAGVQVQRAAVRRLAGQLGCQEVQLDLDDALYEGIMPEDVFLREGPAESLASLPGSDDPEYEPALLEARLQHHLAQLAARETQITELEQSLLAIRKENDALRKQHAVADHHLADLGRVVEKVSQALEQAEKLAAQA